MKPFKYRGFSMGKDADGDWRWTITAANHEIVAASTEGFKRKRDCVANLKMTARLTVEFARMVAGKQRCPN